MPMWTAMPGAVIRVSDYKNLLGAWRHYRRSGAEFLIKRFEIEKPLTDAQRDRLSQALLAKLGAGPGDAIEWLERLHRMDAPE